MQGRVRSHALDRLHKVIRRSLFAEMFEPAGPTVKHIEAPRDSFAALNTLFNITRSFSLSRSARSARPEASRSARFIRRRRARRSTV